MVVCSQKVVEMGSILESFWRSKSLLDRFLRGSKKQQKSESIFGRFGVPKRGPKSFQNRSFFDVVSGTLFWKVSGSIFDRFLVDLGVIFGCNSNAIQTEM